MQNWKLTLTYDGTDFAGWQVQPGRVTVQGELRAALGRVFSVVPEEIALPQGSGRTDAGVHALAQVASIELPKPIPAENLLRALNRTLPAALRVVSAEAVGEEFHARYSAVSKHYEYRLLPGNATPFQARYVWGCHWKLDFARMQRAAADVVGEHDFSSFQASDPDKSSRESEEELSAVRTIYSSAWTEEDGLLVYRVHGDGFLHHMVRNLVGTMVEIGRGQFEADAMPRILAATSRSAAGPTAPARGLYLARVVYSVSDGGFGDWNS